MRSLPLHLSPSDDCRQQPLGHNEGKEETISLAPRLASPRRYAATADGGGRPIHPTAQGLSITVGSAWKESCFQQMGGW